RRNVLGGVYTEGAALLGTRALSVDDLRSLPVGRYVDVSCDSLVAEGAFKNGQHAYICKIGGCPWLEAAQVTRLVRSKSRDGCANFASKIGTGEATQATSTSSGQMRSCRIQLS